MPNDRDRERQERAERMVRGGEPYLRSRIVDLMLAFTDQESAELRQELTAAEIIASKLVDVRDLREEQINQISDALGDDTEWSNCNDRGENAVELAAELVDDLAECKRQLATQTQTADRLFVARGEVETKLARIEQQLTAAREVMAKIRRIASEDGMSAEPTWHELSHALEKVRNLASGAAEQAREKHG